MSNETLEVANTILEQLGGGRFRAFTGAKGFVGGPDSLMFSIPKADRGINKVRVTLSTADDYTMTFVRIVNSRKNGLQAIEIARVDGVYCDQLQDIFLRETGLFTRFGQ